MGLRPEGCTIDRIDNEKGYYKENCQWLKHNLQIAKQGLTSANKSGFKGVIWHKGIKRWQSFIVVDKHNYHLGSFGSIEEAYLCRQIAYNQIYKTFLMAQVAQMVDEGVV